MGQKVTLGGERLGSGNKMKVDLHTYNRSTHDLSYIWRSTMSPGTLVPFMSQIALPGDTWDIDLQAMVNTHPALGPLFGTMKLQLDIFETPLRLYNSKTHNNQLNIGRNMAAVKFPVLVMAADPITPDTPDVDNCQINPSCILKYLGLSGIGDGSGEGGQEREFNAIPFLAYWDIVKNYYANKQEEIGGVIHTPIEEVLGTVDSIEADGEEIPLSPSTTLVQLDGNTQFNVMYTPPALAPKLNQIMIKLLYGGWRSLAEITNFSVDNGIGQITANYNVASFGIDYAQSYRYITNDEMRSVKPRVQTFPLQNIDLMRQDILEHNGASPWPVSGGSDAPYGLVLSKVNNVNQALSSQEGLAVKTYQSDLHNNWVSSEWIEGTSSSISEITSVSTVGDVFTIDSLIIAKKVYNMLNRIAVSGGTYKDWLDVVYQETPMWLAESPIYCGGLSKEIIFQEVVSNSQSDAANSGGTAQPLGTLAGKGTLGKKHKGGHVVIKVNEPSYITGIVSITPRIDYSQGNSWDMLLKTWDDLHKPALDQIGFQDLQQEQLAWWTTYYQGDQWNTVSAGKQPAWTNYTTNVNKTYGNFAIASNEMFMTLNRRYEWQDTGETALKDLTTYIDPAKFNFIFADPSIDAQNFWIQIGVDITCRRLMAAKLMPNL